MQMFRNSCQFCKTAKIVLFGNSAICHRDAMYREVMLLEKVYRSRKCGFMNLTHATIRDL